MPQTGVNVLISVETSDGEKQVIGGQRSATLNREMETIDATHKQLAGWAYSLAGQGSWSIETDGVVLEDDSSLRILNDKFENKEALVVDFTIPGVDTYTGDAILTTYPIEAPMDDVLTYSMTFTGQGKYERQEDTGGETTP
ncbi:phage major tail protein, TP901-1 family [Salinicoccus albus]|uniref:phage major tail protein, TP901-1 family n=1 Tax=Salinicoccus albus TaxID=418756 RepID=UPI00035E2BC1|nr:phage major tail protein, TP901-1 family [Salinicoccus albus]